MTTDVATKTGTGERERVIGLLRTHEAALRALGVEHLDLFGSTARGDDHADSDVDVIIHIRPGRKFSLFDLGEVRVELCELLRRDVGVVIDEDISPGFRRGIAADRIAVF